MNVHLVTRDYEDADRKVLGKLARYLSRWSASPEPNPQADINHFMCYIEYAERFPGWHYTPISAYFTHYETGNANKERWWKRAAEDVDLRIITAKQYEKELSKHGPTVLVKPPLDRELFRPADREVNEKKVVGVAGFVDQSGRKGETLVEQLAGFLAAKADVIAAGKRWPVPCQMVSYRDLPSFYNSLDVFLCSSTIEGIPMPPLEALACGVPVVIPKGVGMLDDLPRMRGIYRYEAGNLDQMTKAIKIALRDRHNRDKLRAATTPYTIEDWQFSHLRAFEDLLFGQRETDALPPWRGNSGLYMVAFGEPSRRCAEKAISTFKKHNPDVPVALASTESLGLEDILIEHPDTDVAGRGVKTRMWDLAPQEWTYVLYLDADTEIVAPLDFIFQVLEDGWEFVICKEPGKFHSTLRMTRPDNEEECEATYRVMGTKEALQLNGGVCAFRRCERTERLIRGWHDEWDRWGKRDQAALFRSLYTHAPRTYVLGVEWNTVVQYYGRERSAGVIHNPMEARRWDGIIWDRVDSPEAWQKVRLWEKKNQRADS